MREQAPNPLKHPETLALPASDLCGKLQVDVQVERASRAVVTANTVTPAKGRGKPAMESKVCKFFLTAVGCKFGDDCHYKHPRTTGKCLRCGAEGHSLSSCTRPSKSKSEPTSKQSTKIKKKGHSTPTSTPSRPSSSAKPKAQPKKKSAKGGGKGKKDKPSVKSSTKSSAKAGDVSFDNDDAEEEDHDAEYDWDEDEEYVAEEEQGETFADHAFATPYHSHVCAVHDLDDGELERIGSTVTPGEPQKAKANRHITQVHRHICTESNIKRH